MCSIATMCTTRKPLWLSKLSQQWRLHQRNGIAGRKATCFGTVRMPFFPSILATQIKSLVNQIPFLSFSHRIPETETISQLLWLFPMLCGKKSGVSLGVNSKHLWSTSHCIHLPRSQTGFSNVGLLELSVCEYTGRPYAAFSNVYHYRETSPPFIN